MIYKRLLPNTLTILVLLVVAILFLFPHLSLGAGDAAAEIGAGDTALHRVLWWLVSSLFGFLTWLTGGLLDWSIENLVLKFGEVYATSGLGVAVNNLWTVVRDLFNLTFIFGLIFIGFKLILSNDTGAAKKAIGSLIIAALLVNFSLFITKTVIDFSNIAAVQVARIIYNSNQNGQMSISTSFAQQMGLSGVWAPQSNAAGVGGGTTPKAPPGFIYIFGTMIILVIAAFCFAVGFVLLMVRFVTLNFLMILSPIMFIGMVFPNLDSWSSDFKKKLLSQSFFAPAFLLMIYFSLYTLGAFNSIIRGGGAHLGDSLGATLTNSTAPNLNAFAGFLIGGGFLVASVMIAQKMSIGGADTAMKWGKSLSGTARDAALALPRLGARQTVGRTGAYFDKKMKNAGWRSDNFLRTAAHGMAEAKYGSSKSFTSVKKLKEEAEKNAKEAKKEKSREDAIDAIDKAIAAYLDPKTQNQDTKIAMERAISTASSEQVNKLLTKYKDDKPEDKAKKDMLISNMSSAQFNGVIKAKDDEFNDGEKKNIAEARATAVKNNLEQKARDAEREKATKAATDRGASATDAATEGIAAAAALGKDEAVETALSKASTEQLKVLGEKTLTEARTGRVPLASYLSLSQIDDIKKSDFTETEKDRIIQTHKEGLITNFQGAVALGPRAVGEFLKKFKDDEKSKLPKDIIGKEAVWEHLSGGTLGEMKKAFTQEERQKIKTYVMNKGRGNHPAWDWFDSSPAAKNFV